MKIGILTTFSGADEAYSLVVVVKSQLQMLKEYNPTLYVSPSFTGEGVFSDRITNIRRTVQGNATKAEIIESLEPQLLDIDVMVCHDIVFLSQHTQWAEAICDISKRHPNIAWIHWQHSRGDGIVNDHPENSWFAYPNKDDLKHCATINKVSVDRVHYVPHPLDFSYLGWPDLAVQIAEDFDFPFVDVSGILPARLDRHKQIEKAVRLFAGLKRAGRSVCFLCADAYATGEHFVQYKREVEKIAKEQGLTEKEFAFLGEQYPDCKYNTPRKVVKALYEMGNLFIQPSTSETSSLVAMEAAMAGNLLVINSDFPPIIPLYKKALSLPFGSVFEDTKYYRNIRTADGSEIKIEDAQHFWDDQARSIILPTLDSQINISVKRQQLQERWPSRVFKEHMLPLLQLAYKSTPHLSEAQHVRGDPEITAIITGLDNLPMLQRQIPILQEECGHIIVVNNGSRDGTKDWLDQNQIPGVSYINKQNNGAGPGRNAGLDMWAESTPYVLLVDGGILPPVGGAAALKDYLLRHPEVDVISPEISHSCFTTDEKEATLRVTSPVPENTFVQRCLTSTAYCLTNARAWKGLRFSEEGPFSEPGWGVDDNEMAYHWNEASILHHEFTSAASGWKLYRRASGSFQRLFEETGVWPNQYGSVYEKRVVKCFQDWRKDNAGLLGKPGIPTASYIIKDILMPDFAKLVKQLHNKDGDCEILASDYDPEVKHWLDTFALRWEWGDCTFDPEGKRLNRGIDYPEELWSGNVVRNRGPLSPKVVTITKENVAEYLESI